MLRVVLALLLAAGLWFAGTAAAASRAVPNRARLAIGSEGSYALSRSFTYLEDAGGELTLADLLKPDAQARFSRCRKPARPPTSA
jgi:hypothetical protein